MKTKATPIALTLAALVLHTIPAAGAPSACQASAAASASRVKTAAAAFTSALGSDAQRRFSDGFRAALYANAYLECAGGLGQDTAVGLGPVGGGNVCSTAIATASIGAADAGAQIRTAAGPADGMLLAADKTAGFLRSFLARPAPEPMRQSASALLAAVEEGTSVLRSCSAEFSKPVLERKAMPAAPAPPPALTAFDGYIGSHLAVHLDSGKATVGSAEATLDGGVTISLKSDPSTKVSVNGHVVLRVAAAMMVAPGGGVQAAGGISAAGIGANLAQTGGPSIRTWSSLEGQGSVSVSLWGWNVALGGGDGVRAGSDGVVFFGNRSFDFLGCRYETDDSSRFEATDATFHGRLACGSFLMTDSTTKATPSGRSGAGKLGFFGHSYDMTYDLSTSRLKAHGRYQAPSTGWTRMPGLDAEYRVSRPTVDVSLDGPSVSATFDTDKVEVETVSKNKSGQPWAQASMNPDPVTVGADGSFLLRLAQLPSVSDTERAARDLCLTAANKIPPGNGRNAAVAACNSDHPSPPSIPNVPTSITVSVGVVVK
jgi:hypothetical protein